MTNDMVIIKDKAKTLLAVPDIMGIISKFSFLKFF